MRRAGELLSEREMATGARGNPGGRGAPIVRSPGTTTQTLTELGITKDQSAGAGRRALDRAAALDPADSGLSLTRMPARA